MKKNEAFHIVTLLKIRQFEYASFKRKVYSILFTMYSNFSESIHRNFHSVRLHCLRSVVFIFKFLKIMEKMS